jgi:hypothetical protein
MRRLVFSAKTFVAGGIIGLFIMVFAAVLLRFTDLAMYFFLPGIAVTSWLCNCGIHDPNGLLSWLFGALLDLVMYSVVATLVVSFFRSPRNP